MKIAYLILCHKDPHQVIRLIKSLTFERSFFVIHVDKRADGLVYEALKFFAVNSADILLATQAKCYWGNFGIVQATLNCIDKAMQSGRSFDYAMLLSGQDYPLKPVADIHAFLESNSGLEFIEAFRLDLPNRWTPHGGPFQAMNRVRYFTFFIRSRPVHIKTRRRFPYGWAPHGGSQWWCLTRECTAYVHEFLKNTRSFLRFFQHVFIPDETMFQSLIANSPFTKNISGDDLRYIDWTNPNPNYPRTLEVSDFDKIKLSSCLIGRKVDSLQSAELLDLLDYKEEPK